MMIGTFEPARSRRQTSKPSIPGRPMSSTTSRTGWRRSSATASSPDRSHTTRQPSCCSRYALTRRPIDSSSSTSRRTPPVAVALMLPYLLANALDLHDLRRDVRLVVDDHREPRAETGDAREADGALDAGRRVDLDDLRRPVRLGQRDVLAGDGGDDPAVDPPVLRAARRLDDHLGPHHAGAEELIDHRPRERHAAAGEPE